MTYDKYIPVLAERLLVFYRNLWPINVEDEKEDEKENEKRKHGNQDYDRISEYVKNELVKKLAKHPRGEKKRLGVTISPSTIERILNHTYKIAYLKNGKIHPESEKILNKFAICLDCINWYDFVAKAERLSDTRMSEIEEFIRKSIVAYINMFKEGKTIKKISPYCRKNGSYYNSTVSKLPIDKGLKIKVYEKPVDELVTFTDFVSYENVVTVRTIEYWNIYAYNDPAIFTNERSRLWAMEFFYLLVKDRGLWKIEEKINHSNLLGILPFQYVTNKWGGAS